MVYSFQRVFVFVGYLFSLCLMSACTTSGPSAPLLTLKEIAGAVTAGEPKMLNVKKGPYRYLHAQLGKKMALLVLGRVEQTTDGRVEIWYGADGLTLKLNDQGRIVGVWGLSIEWTNTNYLYPIPFIELQREQTFTRVRDEMPGYYIGMRELVRVKPLTEVPSVIRREFRSKQIQWFEESASVKGGARGSTLYAYYGWAKKSGQGQPEWVYGHQCLAEDYCLTWFKDPKEVFQ